MNVNMAGTHFYRADLSGKGAALAKTISRVRRWNCVAFYPCTRIPMVSTIGATIHDVSTAKPNLVGRRQIPTRANSPPGTSSMSQVTNAVPAAAQICPPNGRSKRSPTSLQSSGNMNNKLTILAIDILTASG
jgi:hypothetical protein